MSSIIYKENDNVYVDISFPSGDLNYTGSPTAAPTGSQTTPMEYNVDKTLLILDKCSDYYCSVIRFDIPLQTIPLFIMKIIPAAQQSGPVNPNLTPYIIGISYLGTDYPVNLLFSYGSLNPVVVPQQSGNTQIISPYYYVYDYTTMINMFNVGLSTVWTSSGLAAAYSTLVVPFFYLDPVTQLINLVAPSVFSTLPTPPVPSNIPLLYINTPLVKFLNSFALCYNVPGNQPNGKDFIFRLTNLVPATPTPTTQVYPTPDMAYAIPGGTITSPPTYYRYTEEFNSLEYWSSLRKLAVTAIGIPINFENIQTSSSNTGVAVSFPIITDFVIPIETAGASRSIAYYNPTAQYRLVDMLSDSPLYRIGIKVYWVDTLGTLYPMTITINQIAGLKLGFFRKTLYKGPNLLTH